MSYNRRKFLKDTAGIGSGLAFASMTGITLAGCDLFDDKINPFGLQLYTLRDVLPANPKEVLKQVASYGYNQIESYEGNDGMFWGMGNKGFRQFIDDLGMTLVASHCDVSKDFERKANEAAEVGIKHLYCPWKGPQPTIDHFKKIADEFNAYGEICRKSGIRFGYHNHDYSFKEIEGQIPQDVLMNNTDPALVDYEMDIYWVVTAGQDPISWFKKYPGRFKSSHIKDRSSTPEKDNGKNSVDLGTGTIDFKSILKAGSKNSLDYYFVEQEAYPGGSSLKAVENNAGYMKKLKI